MSRTETQHLCSDLISIEVSTPGGRQRRSTANLESISATGAEVQTSGRLRTDAPVRLLCGNCEFRGKVAGCRYQKDLGYTSEIRFEAGETWSRDRFTPQHLLDPSQLTVRRPHCCDEEEVCPREQIAALLEPGTNVGERVRTAARAVAGICGDLDERSARQCFAHLFQIPPECRMGGEFALAYRTARRSMGAGGRTRTLKQKIREVLDSVGAKPRQGRRKAR